MLNLNDISIYLVDINKQMCYSWSKYFGKYENVSFVYGDLESLLKSEVLKFDCVVSPANSFGLMDGGYDLAISNWYGFGNIKLVQDKIKNEWYGEQNIGTSLTIKTNSYPEYIIHTPTMTTPSIINDSKVVYNCMRATLIKALKHNIKSIIIPAFGGGTGGISCELIAKQMYNAYEQIDLFLKDNPNIDWTYAIDTNNKTIL